MLTISRILASIAGSAITFIGAVLLGRATITGGSQFAVAVQNMLHEVATPIEVASVIFYMFVLLLIQFGAIILWPSK